jgi:hydrogenase expression/formation protein HypE
MEDRINIGHGDGGKLTQDLIKEVFLDKFKNAVLSRLEDSAIVEIEGQKIAFTTDSYTLSPIFIPGGDIGKLAVTGTINDLAVMGAKPLFLSCAFVIEEGFETKTLKKLVDSMQKEAEGAGVALVTGDTKVVEKGSVDQIFINTSGIGLIISSVAKDKIEIGDKILINGSIGDHGACVLAQRNKFNLNLKTDCASLHGLIENMLKTSSNIKFMRDPTRGGIAAILNEIIQDRDFGILIDEDRLPIKDEVMAFCEILGFDPFQLANEGKVIAVVGMGDAPKVLKVMKEHPLGQDAEIIGEIIDEPRVLLKTKIGTHRIIDMPIGIQLPRIC